MAARMQSSGLQIAENLTLPTSIVGMRMPVLAEPGAGKSVFVAVLMEELWRLRLQFVSIDPLGTAWGIKTSADGKSAGIAVPYLGGTSRYADAPLRPDGGALVAKVLVESGVSMMLNVSPFSRADQNRFVADFWNELLRIAGDRHSAGEALSILNLTDEAGFFMPEMPRGKEAARAQDAGERVARQGRGLGLGFVAPTQRPQGLDKDVLSVWEVLVLMRLTEPAAIKQAMGMIEHVVEKDTLADIRRTLPRLRDGEAWIISPRVLGITKRVQIRMRRTYDSTRTPTPGERRLAPTSLAQADLSALRSALAASRNEDGVPEPVVPTGTGSASASVRAAITSASHALERENVRLRAELEATRLAVPERIDVPVLTDADRAALHDATVTIGKADALLASVESTLASIAKRVFAAVEPPTPPRIVAVRRKAETRKRAPREPMIEAAAQRSRHIDESAARLKKGARRMLATLASTYPLRLTAAQVSALAKLTTSGGTFGAYMSTLKREGCIRESGGLLEITTEGFAAIGMTKPTKPTSRAQAIAGLRSALKAGARTMFDVLSTEGKRGATREELAIAAGMTASGGTFGAYLAILKRNGLVIEEKSSDGTRVRVNESLFTARKARSRDRTE